MGCCREKDHCLHSYTGPILMVVPNGHVVLKCCQCKCMVTRHPGHLGDPKDWSW